MSNHVFISYSRKDQDFVHRLAERLERRGVLVWRDQPNIPAGADWNQAIDDALDSCAALLVVLSPDSARSDQVISELLTAQDKGKLIVPVLHRPCAIPRLLKTTQYIDFTSRTIDNEAGLEQILQSLRASVSIVSPRKSPAVSAPLPFEPKMILIRAGEFIMGSAPNSDRHADIIEQPQHRVYLPNYYIGETPITQAQYSTFVQETHYRQPDNWSSQKPPSGKEYHPVVLVNFYDAAAYCDWLAQKTQRPYRLPSEAEWEKAARGLDGRIYPWGDPWDSKRCNTEESGIRGTTPVGSFPSGASPYGLLDMAGNVFEWTLNVFMEYPYDPRDGREDFNTGGRGVLRGGAFSFDAVAARCAFRGKTYLENLSSDRGFRVVMASM